MADFKAVSVEEAIEMLPDREQIHTFRSSAAGLLIGTDWYKTDIIVSMKKYGVCLSGPTATRMNHGLYIQTPLELFVETKPQTKGDS